MLQKVFVIHPFQLKRRVIRLGKKRCSFSASSAGLKIRSNFSNLQNCAGITLALNSVTDERGFMNSKQIKMDPQEWLDSIGRGYQVYQKNLLDEFS